MNQRVWHKSISSSLPTVAPFPCLVCVLLVSLSFSVFPLSMTPVSPSLCPHLSLCIYMCVPPPLLLLGVMPLVAATGFHVDSMDSQCRGGKVLPCTLPILPDGVRMKSTGDRLTGEKNTKVVLHAPTDPIMKLGPKEMTKASGFYTLQTKRQ